MRDLLSKLDRILLEETTLQDLKKEPMAKDPMIAKAIKDKEREEGQEESSDKERDTSWMRDPEDPESKIPAMFRKEKAAGRSAAEKSIDDLNKKAGAKVWRSPRESFEIGDEFGISVTEDFEIGAEIVDVLEDGVVIELDETALEFLTQQGFTFEDGEIVEEKQKGLDGKACWKGYRRMGTKMKGGKRVDNCVKVGEDSDVEESGLQYYTGKKKYGKEGMAALAAAGRKGASEEELGRIKDRYKKEDIVSEAESYGKMPADAVRTLYNVYKDESQGVRQHDDREGAERIGKALNDTARELGVSKYMRSLYNSAAGSAHMDFDTNPGDFVNWFTYVGSHLEGLYKIHKEKGSYDDSPDFEVEKEDFEKIDEFFYFDEPDSKKKDRGPRDHGEDELERRQKSFRKHELAKDGRDYKDAMSPKSKSPFKGKYNIAGPKGKLPEDAVAEAEYQGREVPLGKPMKGDVKKSKVYVKNPQGNVVKVNFGDKKMRIKKSNPSRRKSFRARHNCANPGPRHKARYWSCRAW